MKDVAVVAYCRTGIARATRGALNQTHGIPMTAHVLRLAVKRADIDPAEVEDVIVGCGLPEGATGHNIARNAALEAGFGEAVPGMTVNRYCGSGLSAASIVANRIAAGEATVADVDLWELHEAYAVTTLYNQAQLETPWEITNVNGGAAPLGHPYGMSGIRYLGSTLLELGRRGRNRAIVGVCTAGGMSTAAYLERP